MLLKQLQIQPYDFLDTIKTVSNDSICYFVTELYNTEQYEILNNMFLFLGQEGTVEGKNTSNYKRVLNILHERNMEVYYYILSSCVPILLNYQLELLMVDYYTSLIHLTCYNKLLVNALHFLEENNNLQLLIITLQEKPEFLKYLIRRISHDDKEFSLLMLEIKEATVEPIQELEPINNIDIAKKTGESMLDNAVKQIDGVDNNLNVDNQTQGDRLLQNIEETPVEESKLNPEVREFKMPTVNEDFVMEEQQNARRNINHNEIPETLEEYQEAIPKEKMDLLENFMNVRSNDIYYLIASDPYNLEHKVRPSKNILEKIINNPVNFYNTSLSKEIIDISNLGNMVHLDHKPTIYFDAMNGIHCNKSNPYHICSASNPYEKEFKYVMGGQHFSLSNKIHNLNMWIHLFENLEFKHKYTTSAVNSIYSLYNVVFVVQLYIFKEIFNNRGSKHNINVAQYGPVLIIGVDGQETDDYLNFYLFSKFFGPGDLLLTGDNYSWLDHELDILIEGQRRRVEEFLPMKINNLLELQTKLHSLYPEYIFYIILTGTAGRKNIKVSGRKRSALKRRRKRNRTKKNK